MLPPGMERYIKPINPFPYIYKTRYNFNFKETLQDKVDSYLEASKSFSTENNAADPEREGGITGVHICGNDKIDWEEPHNWEEMSGFIEWLQNTVPIILESWGIHPNFCKFLAESWINVHPHEGYTSVHHHHNALIAVAAYLDVPEYSGNLRVKNPMNDLKFSEPVRKGYHEYDMDWAEIEVNTNDVLFFPGWLVHSTEPNASFENRYVMSLNISSLRLMDREWVFGKKGLKFTVK